MKKKIDISRIDVRVAKVLKAEIHPNNPKSFVSTVDVGDANGSLRKVVSGLASYVPLEEMQGRYVIAVCNLKPAKFQGIESNAMLLAASAPDGSIIELLNPPAESEVGEAVVCEGYEAAERDSEILNPKHKIFEKISEDFKVNVEGVATFRDLPFCAKNGVVTTKTLKEGTIR